MTELAEWNWRAGDHWVAPLSHLPWWGVTRPRSALLLMEACDFGPPTLVFAQTHTSPWPAF